MFRFPFLALKNITSRNICFTRSNICIEMKIVKQFCLLELILNYYMMGNEKLCSVHYAFVCALKASHCMFKSFSL